MASSANPTEQTPLLTSNVTASSDDVERDMSNDENTTDSTAVTLDETSTIYITKAVSGVFLGLFVAAVDSSIIATLSAPISATFDSQSRLPWLMSAFFIANATIQPLSGKLTDIYGRRGGLILSNIVFATGNLICTFAKSEWVLISGRLVAGIGGGGLAAVSTFVLSDLVPLRQRGLWQGIGNMCLGAGSGLGAFFGGWLNDSYGWKAAFAIQVPVTFIAIILVFFTVNIPTIDETSAISTPTSKFRRIDFLGAITLFTTLTLMLLALSSGGNLVPWSHPLVLITLPLSLASFLIFLIVELKYAMEPIIPVTLLWNRSIAAACLTNTFMCMSRFALLFYLPIYLQVQGYSPTQTGLRLIPGSIATAITSLACGIFIRWTGRYYKIGVLSQIIYLIGMGIITTFNLNTPAWPPFLWFFIANIGFGIMLTTTILAILASIEQKHQAVMTSALFAFRSTGTVLGITLAGLTFQNVLRVELWRRIGEIDDAEEVIKRVIADLSIIGEFPEVLRERVLRSHMIALRGVFLVLLGMGGFGAIASLFIEDRELPSKMSRRGSD